MTDVDGNLFRRNTPWDFWQLLAGEVTPADWCAAARRAAGCLEGLPVTEIAPPGSDEGGLLATTAAVLGEGQFGTDHWQLSELKRLYYAVRPMLPEALRPLLRRVFQVGRGTASLLGWPVEDRYVRFQFDTLRHLMESRGLTSVPYVHFWPDGRRFALVLTHDVETLAGQRFVREVASLEARYGFRSAYNFVPRGYAVDRDLTEDLRERGLEVGVHGLGHDGRMFASKETFLEQARSINQYVRLWKAAGFRSPMTHRQPDWMQALEVEYDSSFFDTDPYETIPGGTMSIWPFVLGRFVELPYTLAQDHTLMVTLGETSPRLWLDKVDFVARNCGLALLITHPDYLRQGNHLAIYEQFLKAIKQRQDYWQALPRDVARWWRRRLDARPVGAGGAAPPELPGAVVWRAASTDSGLTLQAL